MIEDGYFISFFSDDEAKKREPRNIIVIKNGKVSFYINPKESEENKEWLLNLKERLSKLENNKKQYKFEFNFFLMKSSMASLFGIFFSALSFLMAMITSSSTWKISSNF